MRKNTQYFPSTSIRDKVQGQQKKGKDGIFRIIPHSAFIIYSYLCRLNRGKI